MGSNAERYAAVHAKARELLVSDPDLKAMAVKSPYPAFKAALAKAAEMIPPGSTTPRSGPAKPIAQLSGPPRDDRLRALTLTLLRDDADLRELAKSDGYGAFKRAMKKANIQLKGYEREWARKEN